VVCDAAVIVTDATPSDPDRLAELSQQHALRGSMDRLQAALALLHEPTQPA
jgi:hypothetical protein